MEALPSEIKAIIGSLLDDRSRRVMRLANTQWFHRIRYNDFNLYFTKAEQVPHILTRLGRYASLIGITFRRPKCILTKQDYEMLGQLTQLRKLIVGRAMRNNVPVEDLHPLTNLTNLEEADAFLPADIMYHVTSTKDINLISIEHAKLLDLARFSKLVDVQWFPRISDPPRTDLLLAVPHTRNITRLCFDSIPRETIDETNLMRYYNLKELTVSGLSQEGNEKPFDMPHLPNLEKLTLRVKNIGSLSQLHEKLTAFSARCERLHSPSLAALTKLQNFKLEWFMNEITLTDLQVLTALTNLENLTLRYNHYTNNSTDWTKAFQFISSALTALELHQIECKMDRITKFGNLKSLELTNFASENCAELGTLSNLTNLALGELRTEIFSVIETLTNLKRLTIDNSYGFYDASDPNNIPTVFHIVKLSGLEELSFGHFEGVQVEENQLQYLPLKSLTIGWLVSQNFLEIASNLTALHHLDLRRQRYYQKSHLFNCRVYPTYPTCQRGMPRLQASI
eukprot:TRINITY_DN778_c0_g1_i1.p1 TRINITY_DN778_c0_g1~~TRINITY_DN778_c0_g1_i1.p1  ORF type:complete len:510 (-),score=19.58 TRINITY_DN778_c0_g1_i1:84-1613(-)